MTGICSGGEYCNNLRHSGLSGFTSKLTNSWKEWDNSRILHICSPSLLEATTLRPCLHHPVVLCFLISLLQQGGGVEMRLNRVMLAACMNCTKMYLPCGGNFYSKCLFSSVSTFCLRLGGTRTLILSRALKYTVPFGNRKLGLYSSRSYSDISSNVLCRQTLLVSRCQPRKSTAVRKENLLQGGATWPGKNETEE